MAEDAYAYWRAMLEHVADKKKPPLDFDVAWPPSGFYRHSRDHSAVAIWMQNGQCFAKVHRPNRTGGGLTVRDLVGVAAISEPVFAYCSKTPITHEAYLAFVKDGVWPEDVVLPKPAPIQTNENDSRTAEPAHVLEKLTSSEDEFSVALAGVIASAEAYLNDIGRKVTEKVHADRIANYAIASGAIATRAESARVEAKRPILEAGRAIDARWGPIVTKAEKVTKNLKTILVPYFNEQKRKASEEAAEAQEAREASTLAGETPPLASARPSPTTAGTQGRVYLKGQKVYRITDLRAAAEFIAKLNQPPQEFVDGVQASVVKLIKAGVEVPGAEVKIEDVVA